MKVLVLSIFVAFSATCWGSPAPEIVLPSRAGDYWIETDPTVTPPLPNYFGIAVADSNTRRKISKLPGFFRTDDSGADDMLSWQPSGAILAINVPDDRRTSHIELFHIDAERALRLTIPDYKAEIAKRIKSAPLSDYSGYTSITGWHGDLFIFEFDFRAYEADTQKYRGFYFCSIALHIDPKTHSVSIDSVTDPVAD